MKRTGAIAFAAVCAIILTSTPAGAKQTSAEREAAELQAKREKEAAAALNGTTWVISMTRLGQKSDKPLQDTLKFDAGKITSIQFAKNGYIPSNYTVTVGDGSLVVWETMQAKEGAGVVFWRGERQGEAMQGILSKQPADGKNEDFSFSGKIAGVPPAPPAAPAAADRKSVV